MISCDEKYALESCFDKSIIVTHRTKNYYLILVTSRMDNGTTTKIMYKHTKSKQLLRVIPQELDYWEMQNIEVGTNEGLLIHGKKHQNGV